MKLEELKEEVKKDLIIQKDRLNAEADRTPIIHNKYLIELCNAKDQLHQYEHEYNTMYRDRWLYYTGKGTPEDYAKEPLHLKILKSDLDIFLNADQKLADKRYQVSIIKLKIEFIEKTLGEIGRRSFHISNSIKALQFYHGVIG